MLLNMHFNTLNHEIYDLQEMLCKNIIKVMNKDDM